MGLFNIFKKKKVVLTEEQLNGIKYGICGQKGEAESPYAELMTYQSEN